VPDIDFFSRDEIRALAWLSAKIADIAAGDDPSFVELAVRELGRCFALAKKKPELIIEQANRGDGFSGGEPILQEFEGSDALRVIRDHIGESPKKKPTLTAASAPNETLS
jgi:hypothetical protein